MAGEKQTGGRYANLQRNESNFSEQQTGGRYDSKRERRSSETLLDNDLLAPLRADVDLQRLFVMTVS